MIPTLQFSVPQNFTTIYSGNPVLCECESSKKDHFEVDGCLRYWTFFIKTATPFVFCLCFIMTPGARSTKLGVDSAQKLCICTKAEMCISIVCVHMVLFFKSQPLLKIYARVQTWISTPILATNRCRHSPDFSFGYKNTSPQLNRHVNKSSSKEKAQHYQIWNWATRYWGRKTEICSVVISVLGSQTE